MRDHSDTGSLLQHAARGDPGALGDLLMRERDRLTRIVRLRMDPRLRGRVDEGDVVQEAFIEATARFAEFARDDKMPFFLWLRFLTIQKLFQLHRRHLGVQARDASREVSLHSGPFPEASSAVLAAQLIGKLTTPSDAAVRAETRLRLEETLNSMDETDREVLALRHFEQLSNADCARVLGITESAASNRYVRAAKRLKSLLERN
jgi:RNA polymerase sigma-70 factor (ECF subfamily)